MKSLEVKIEGMSCQHCVKSVINALNDLKLKEVNVEVGKALIKYSDEEINDLEILKVIEDAGYKIIK